MLKFLYIAFGGAVGALGRYWISGVTYRFFADGFPWGTLAVNLVGSFSIGLVWGMTEAVVVSQNVKVLILVGVLGSFTTFSTFSLENFHLLRDGEYWLAFGNITVSVVLGIAFVFAGFFLSKALVGFAR